MSTTAYFFFTKIDPASLSSEVMDRFNTNIERAVAVSFRYPAVRIFTGTCKTDGDSEVYIHICDTEHSASYTLQTFRLKERIIPEINRLYAAAGLRQECQLRNISVKITPNAPELTFNGNREETGAITDGGEYDYTARAAMYRAEKPLFTFERVILPEATRRQLDEAVAVIKYSSTVLGDWGLRDIMSSAVALNFYGQPGTGKTMAAEAIASSLGRKIIRASCSDIESKYHGESAKMVKAIFLAAEQQNAVLFIDEADSLLSSRIEQITQSADQAINSMRSQLLLSLERYRGVVIFATNLIASYDKAFISRLRCIHFPLPTPVERREIWNVHLYPTASSQHVNIPLADDVDIGELADSFELTGRDIREAVKSACFRTAMAGLPKVDQKMLRTCCEDTIARLQQLDSALDGSF